MSSLLQIQTQSCQLLATPTAKSTAILYNSSAIIYMKIIFSFSTLYKKKWLKRFCRLRFVVLLNCLL